MARFTTLLALALVLSIPALPSRAADPDQTITAAKPAVPKHVPAKPKKAKPGDKKIVPQVKAPEVKPVQPPPVPPPAKPADTKPADDKASAKVADAKTGPRFASLRADRVYLRSGPSEDFPILWVFQRRGLPVEIVATFDIWRKIRDSEGTQGWVNQQMLSGRRSVLITSATRDLHHDPDAASEIVAQLEPGVVAAVSRCDPAWCEVKAGGYKGWLQRDAFWGLEPNEVIP